MDEQGNRKRVRPTQAPYTKTAAKDLLTKLIADFDAKGTKAFRAEIKTFKEPADYFEQRYLIPPEYVDGRKVAGIRTYYNGRLYLKTLREESF